MGAAPTRFVASVKGKMPKLQQSVVINAISSPLILVGVNSFSENATANS